MINIAHEMKNRSVGVIGAGLMGGGIAHVMALGGIGTLLYDLDGLRVTAAIELIGRNLDRQVKKGAITAQQRDDAFGKIRAVEGLEDLRSARLVIEAVPENAKIKEAVYASLLPHLADDAILASNTSSISITNLSRSVSTPEHFVGIHFFNPVPLMPLVELIGGDATDQATLSFCEGLLTSIGKTVVQSRDVPGFIVNRLLVPLLNEAALLVEQDVSNIPSIDTAMRLGANHPMGPLTLADFIGLDTVLSAAEVLHSGFGGEKYRPSDLLVKMVASGWLGQKSGQGFYIYGGSEPVPNTRLGDL